MDSGLRVRCAVADGVDINEVPVQNGQIVISSQVSALLYDIMGQHMRVDPGGAWESYSGQADQPVRTIDGKTLVSKDGKILKVIME